MKLIKEVKTIQHKLSDQELAEYSTRNAQLNIDIEDKKAEAKNVASNYTNQVKVLEAKRGELSQKIISGMESREELVYQRKNYVTSTIEFISMYGEIIATEPFRARDYSRQLEIVENAVITKLERIQYFGMKYFYDEFLKINFDIDVSAEEVEEQLETNRVKFISSAVTYLVDKKILNLLDDDDSVEFDLIYNEMSDWYDTFKTKYREEPTEEEYKISEIEQEDKAEEESPDIFPDNLPSKPKGKKGKKKDINQEEGKDDLEDKDSAPDWLKD